VFIISGLALAFSIYALAYSWLSSDLRVVEDKIKEKMGSGTFFIHTDK